MKEIFRNILNNIAVQNMTKKEIYSYLDVSRQGFDNKFKNETLTLNEFLKIAKYMDVKPEELLRVSINGNGNTVQMAGRDASIGSKDSELALLKQENEGLKKEVELLREMISMLKAK